MIKICLILHKKRKKGTITNSICYFQMQIVFLYFPFLLSHWNTFFNDTIHTRIQSNNTVSVACSWILHIIWFILGEMQKNIQWKAELLGKRAFVYALFKGSYCILVYSVCRRQKEPAPLQWPPHKRALHRCSDVPITSGCSLSPLVAHATSNKSIYTLDVLPEPYSNRYHMSSVEQEHTG